ncbi:type II toxin-antitoxin system VapC family toxin [Nocardioides daejeonensis]|uniref:type II toxin-antitoxin system VapC family toxin n=1 Tax=Nocardioides daejeonensis TaxID=1046556 RepID=UPI000D741FAA|nr:type II toxin-antitoxin system VapC family toxin [Nocardioides daejeonensis]
MIVDTSVLIAILQNEEEATEFAELLVAEPSRISAANWLEAAMVAEGSGDPDAARNLDLLVETAGIVIEPVSVRQARAARTAFRRYGRGSGSPARLNLGDCFAYALAVDSGEPLLFKGDDFVHTDVLRAR